MIDRKYFFDNIKWIGKLNQMQVDTLDWIFNRYDEDDKLTNLRQLAYVLATSYHESAHTWNPGIREIGRGKGRSYGIAKKNGNVYYGRGLCQLTWDYNYMKFRDLFHVDFYSNPDLALQTEWSVKILMTGMRDGLFTGKKLSDYFNDNKTDWVNARKIVNGMDRANEIGALAQKFYTALKYKDEISEVIPADEVKSETPLAQAIAVGVVIDHPSDNLNPAYPAILLEV